VVDLSIAGPAIGSIIKQLRLQADISRVQLGAAAGVSASHIAHIENGQRFPSAKVLYKIAPHLYIGEGELLSLAGYVSAEQYNLLRNYDNSRLDQEVAALLAKEPVEVQRAIVSILSIVKYVAEGIVREYARVKDEDSQESILD
jgi:transcriptional regulator with XRE-family HTH domain